jgi:hypothetical protein
LRYLGFLRKVHEQLEPPTYLEIGVRHGKSLTLARARNVGIDPAFELQKEVPPDTALFEETSDEYFDRADPLEPLGGSTVALSFIDGMHLVEFALRDFINVERRAKWTSVVIFDDIYPRDVEEANRRRRTYMWTGDVYKIVSVLARERPDLVLLPVDTQPTGLLLVLGLDPQSTVLDDRYDQILRESVVPDPQEVPAAMLERHGALDPAALLGASFWAYLREAREAGTPAREGMPELRRRVRRELGEGVIARRGSRRSFSRA